VGNEVFVTASYGTGAALLRIGAGAPATIWSGDDSLSAHYATPVVQGGFLYGFHGRQERRPAFRCVEWKTGKVRWSADATGGGTVGLVGDRLVLLLESGEVVLVAASPERYAELARAQVLGRDTRAPFALADGRLWARDKEHLVCLALGQAPPRGGATPPATVLPSR